jgi:hypothetical protein
MEEKVLRAAIASRSLVDCLEKSNYGASAIVLFGHRVMSMTTDPGFTPASCTDSTIGATPTREIWPPMRLESKEDGVRVVLRSLREYPVSADLQRGSVMANHSQCQGSV